MITDQSHDTPTPTTPPAPPTPGVVWQPGSQELQQQLLGQALFRLQEWLMEMYRRDFAQLDDEGVVKINAQVSSRFALGLPPNLAFVVMPDLEAGWACLMPWHQAVMRDGLATLYLVLASITIDEQRAPEFGISFDIPDFAKAKALTMRSELQLRRYLQTDSNWSVDVSHFAQMPIVHVSQYAPILTPSQKTKIQSGAGRLG